MQPYRIFKAGSYAYGFNGRRMDNEIYGTGSIYDYGYRMYDPRRVQFGSLDPLIKKFPWYTPYQFAGNKPIWAKDLDGLEERYFQFDLVMNGKGVLKMSNFKEIKSKRAGYFWVNTNYGYGAGFRIRHEPEGQFGPGAQYDITLHMRNSNGQWEEEKVSLFIPEQTLLENVNSFLEQFGFKTGKEGSRQGGIIFSSGQPFAGRENALNPTAKHPDPYIVPIDELISSFNATNAATEEALKGVDLLKRFATALELGQNAGDVLKNDRIVNKKKLETDTINWGGSKMIQTHITNEKGDTEIIITKDLLNP